MNELQLTFLGGLRVARDGVPISGFISAKVQALLCYLAVTGRPHLRPSLAGLLWGDMPEEKAKGNLRKALSNLRQIVGDHVEVAGQTVRFVREQPYTLDVEEFVRWVEPTLRHRARPKNVAGLVEAASLYRSDLLAGFHVNDAPAFEEWLVVERERLRDLAIKVFYALADHYGLRGENDRAIDYASRLLALEPWHEEAHRQVMLLQARSGRRSAALAQYEACRGTLAEELGVDPMPETTALYERIRVAATHHLHVPAQSTPFIGREEEMAHIAASFDDPACRLLTLVGPGGIGKTRLALHVAEARRHAFLDGVYVVPLAGLDTQELLVPSIVAALPFSFFSRQDARAQLLGYLKEKEMLLVLDSFERVLKAAGLVAEILQSAPQVKVLVTSRERLNLRWEWLFDVRGMVYPAEREAKDLAEYDAGTLFTRMASRVKPGFSAEQERANVARICRLVEGMPLAIELAAAAMRDRSSAQVATEIERNLDLLATSAQDVPERHRSVKAAFEGSWHTLTDDTQRAFRRLAVFRGGGDARAAHQVAGADRALLQVLVAKSLVREAGHSRFELHELVRQYAAAKLDEVGGERQQAEAAHADYYASWLHDRADTLRGREQQATLDEIGREIDNVRAAWHWAILHRHPQVLDRGLDTLYLFYDLRGWLEEGYNTFEQAAAAVLAEDRLSSRILGRLAWFAFRVGRYDQARWHAERSLGLVAGGTDWAEKALGHTVIGRVGEEQGDYAQATEHFQQSLANYERAGDIWGMARSSDYLGNVARMVGDYDRADRCYERCLALYQETGDRHGIAGAFNSLGGAAGTRGAYDRARDYFERSLTICREIDDRFGIASASHNLSTITYLAGDYATAKALRRDVLGICREIGFRRGVADSLRHLGDAHRQLGEHGEARRLYEESRLLKEELGDRRGLALVYSSLGDLAIATGDTAGASREYRRVLDIGVDIDSPPLVLTALAGLAACRAQQGKREAAFELVCFVLQHPASEQQLCDQVAPLYATLIAALDPGVAVAIQDECRMWTLETVVARAAAIQASGA